MNTENKIIELLNASHSPFHAIKTMEKELIENGYSRLDEKGDFLMKEGGKYYVVRNMSSLIAFRLPKKVENLSFNISASHSDSPSFKVKPNPIYRSNGITMLNVEPYGGMIMSSWMDRPLSFAGRVTVLDKEGKLSNRLLDIDEDLLVMANVCIHFNREVNRGYAWNPAADTVPMMGQLSEDFDFKKFLFERLGLEEGEEVAGFDLFLYNRESPKLLGLNKEFLAAQRIDNLTSAYTCLLGLEEAEENGNVDVLAVFDNEEVGSLTKQGANSTFLKDILTRIASFYKADYEKAIANSFLFSVDNAHANHPNHPEYSDRTTHCFLNGGVVIKYNANQKYTSDGYSASILKAFAKKAGIKTQEFTNRSDLPGGSTLGNISNSEVSLNAVDIGMPQLAMHSCYEVMGKDDLLAMKNLLKAFYGSTLSFNEEGAVIQ